MEKLLTTALMILCAFAAAASGAQTAGTLKGRIENEKGKPIAGAEVRVMRSRDRSVKETRTDEAGNFAFELEPDDYTVSFDAEGFQGGNLVAMQQVEAGKETTLKTIRLQRARRTSLIRGAVFDAGGLSLGGVRVRLVRVPNEEEAKEKKKIDSFSRDYITNSRGEFAFRVPPERARYKMTATLSGYKSETKTVDVNEDEAVPLAFNLEPVKK